MTNYIYIRSMKTYKEHVKIGRTDSPVDRDQVYKTSELSKGDFISIYKIDPRENSINIQNIEYKIKKNFDNINYKGTAGTEFFENSIIDDIEPYFNSIGVIYHKLTDNDINDLRRKHKE